MSRERQLVKNTLVLSFGSVVPKLVSLVTLPILTGCLSTADYGTYDLVVSMVTLLLPLATLELQNAAFRFLLDARDDKSMQDGIVTNIMAVTVSISAVVLTVLFLLLASLSFVTRLLICGYYFLDILVTTLRQIARGLSRNELYSLSVITNAVVEGLGIIGFIVLLSSGLNGALFASFLGQLISLLVLARGIRVHSYMCFRTLSLKIVKRMLAYSWPLIPNSLSSWIISMSDRLVLTIMIGIEASAVYATASKIPHILGIVQSAFTLAWQENASLSSTDDDSSEYYTSVFDTVFCLVAGCLALLVAVSPLLFALLIQGDYEAAYVHMNVLFLGAFASCISAFFGGIYVARMKTKEIGATTAVIAVVNLVLKIILVPYLGIYAATLSYTLCYAALALWRAHDLRRFQPIAFKGGKIVATCVALVALVLVASTRTVPGYVVCAVCGILFACLLNKKTICLVARKIKGKISR